MHKITFKRAIPFRTKFGTILADTVLAKNDQAGGDGAIDIVALFDHAGGTIEYKSKCVFCKNNKISTEVFDESSFDSQG